MTIAVPTVLRSIASIAAAAALCIGTAPLISAKSTPHLPSAWTEKCEDWDEWDAPGPPFQIHANSYYVGTCGISVILITGDQGHIVIDSGTQKGAKIVARNIRRLGFRLSDVKWLLHSHEHYDHIGGLALLQKLTGAQIAASRAAAPVIETGQDGADDPQAGMAAPMTPAKVARILVADAKFELGNLRLQAIDTPGHTPGALSWQWQSCDSAGVNCQSIVYADSLSPISNDNYRFSDHPPYLAAFRQGLTRIAAVDCDILITPHPTASDLRGRLLPDGKLADKAACGAYARSITKRLDERLTKEAPSIP